MKCLIAVAVLFAILATQTPDASAYPNQRMGPHLMTDKYAQAVMKYVPPGLRELIVLLTYSPIVLALWQLWGLTFIFLHHMGMDYEGGPYKGPYGDGGSDEADGSAGGSKDATEGGAGDANEDGTKKDTDEANENPPTEL